MSVAMVSLLLLPEQAETTGYIPLSISYTDFHSNHVLALPAHPTSNWLLSKHLLHMSLFYTPYVPILYRSVLFL